MKRAVIVAMSLLFVFAGTACGNKKTDKIHLKADSQESREDSENREKITDEQALAAIRNYCFLANPELEKMVNSEDYTVYWNIESSDENQIVVLYRSYTAAFVRYYIDPVSGETYVTESAPGKTEEEERTDENFNLRDYLEIASRSPK